MAHIVLEGYTPKDGEFVSTGPSVVEGMVNRTPVRALCGKEWVPGRDPGPLRPVPDLQGDRRVHGVEDPGPLSGPGHFVPACPRPATVRLTGSTVAGAARREHVGTGQLRRRHQTLRRHHRGRRPHAAGPRRRAPRAARLVRVRQDDGAAPGGRPGGGERGHRLHRRAGRERRRPQGPRRGHGLPELRALPSPDGGQEHRVPAAPARRRQGGADDQGQAGRRDPRDSAPCSTASRRSSRAASASGSRWPGPSCASRWCS